MLGYIGTIYEVIPMEVDEEVMVLLGSLKSVGLSLKLTVEVESHLTRFLS